MPTTWLLAPPQIFRPSYGPAEHHCTPSPLSWLMSLLRHCTVLCTKGIFDTISLNVQYFIVSLEKGEEESVLSKIDPLLKTRGKTHWISSMRAVHYHKRYFFTGKITIEMLVFRSDSLLELLKYYSPSVTHGKNLVYDYCLYFAMCNAGWILL